MNKNDCTIKKVFKWNSGARAAPLFDWKILADLFEHLSLHPFHSCPPFQLESEDEQSTWWGYESKMSLKGELSVSMTWRTVLGPPTKGPRGTTRDHEGLLIDLIDKDLEEDLRPREGRALWECHGRLCLNRTQAIWKRSYMENGRGWCSTCCF